MHTKVIWYIGGIVEHIHASKSMQMPFIDNFNEPSNIIQTFQGNV